MRGKEGKGRNRMSKIRRIYFGRLAFRIVVLIAVGILYFTHPEYFDIVEGSFWDNGVSPLHIVWGVWVFDMLWQLIPVKNYVSLGSQKHFKQRFKPISDRIHYEALKEHVIGITKAAYKVFFIWAVFILILGALHYQGILEETHLFFLSVVFYVCDLICVLIWCPFRLIMKNRCCTTCRIFNWDHLMMFTPMLFIRSFYAWSLLGLALVVWIVWEACVLLYPERFWEKTNAALKCSECTDKLCSHSGSRRQ